MHIRLSKIVCAAAFSLTAVTLHAQTGNKNMAVKYIDTRKDASVVEDYFGTKVPDPYRWLENDQSAETADWVKKQNEVTQTYLSQIPFRTAIHDRLKSIMNYEKFSAPSRHGKYFYYSRNSGLQNQSVVYRELISGSEPEVFLDPNTFSKDGTTSLAGLHFTKDGSMAAYNISEGGSDWQKIITINAITKMQTPDTINDVKFGSVSWKNNEGFYYSTYDRPAAGSLLAGKTERHLVKYHKLGTAQKDDVVLFGNTGSPIRYTGAYVTEDQRWLIISAANNTTGNALHIMDLKDPKGEIKTMISDTKNNHSIVYNDDKYFYIETDRNAPTNKVVAAPVNDPSESNWKTIIDSRKEVLNLTSAGGYLFGTYLKDAVSKVYQFNTSGKELREVKLPGLGTAGGFSGEEKDKDLFFSYTSYLNPATIYRMNIETGAYTLYKQPKVQFDASAYESKQVFYKSKDGTKIPMIITYKKGTKMNGNNPCLLYGYGGFNISLTPAFSTSNIILLENGGIYAVANIRGGGEYGQEWHDAGTKLKKQNVFDDFIAAANYLVDQKYTSRNMLALEGGSNGGLLVGACITQQPDICKVAFPAVGVMDMLRYHTFTSGAGWAYDYGTSKDSKEMFEYIYKYSPVHNVRPAAYPATMVTTADHDDRVVPAHSFKFASALQANQKGDNPVLIRIAVKAGHGAGKSMNQVIDEQADKWSFMFYNMGISPKAN